MKEQRTCSICPQTFKVKISTNKKTCSMRCARLYKKNFDKEYKKTPEAKKRRKDNDKEYKQRPDVIEARKEYIKNYNKKPEAIKYRKDYQKEYKQRPEAKKRRKTMRIEKSIRQTVTKWENFIAKRPEVKEYGKK